MDTHCRIRSYRPRGGNLSIIVPKPKADFRKAMHQHVDSICDGLSDSESTAGMAWFAITAMSFNGYYQAARGAHPESPIGRVLMPAVISEILRRYAVEDVAMDVVSGKM